jgi:hypothetical protein
MKPSNSLTLRRALHDICVPPHDGVADVAGGGGWSSEPRHLRLCNNKKNV